MPAPCGSAGALLRRKGIFSMRFFPTPWFVASLAFVVLGFSRGIHSSFGVLISHCWIPLVGAAAQRREFSPSF